MSGRRILVNESFAMQRITGQQRYASEISSRVLRHAGFEAIRPRGWWASSALRVWAWLQLVLPLRSADSVLLSMTARAPLWHSRQVLVVHDLFVLTNPEWFSRKYVITHAPLLRVQLRRAKAVIAVSEPVAAQVSERYDGPVSVAPNAPSTVFSFPATDASALESRSLSSGAYFLAVGSIDPRKNLPRLAAAYAALPAATRAAHPLVVVGGGHAVFRDQQIAWPEGTIDAGYVTDDELRELYRGARAVVFVSYAEGFGLPLVESAASGTRSLVISDIPVFRWICGDDATYVDPYSVPSITAGLLAAIESPVPQGIDLARFRWDESAETVRRVCITAGVTA